MPWLETPATVLRYDVQGAGPDTLVLLHEMGGTLESWDELMPALTARYRVIRYDQRGAGLSEKPTAPFTMQDASADLIALLDGLGVTGPVDLCGIAVGGGICLLTAATYPDRVRAVVVASPVVKSPSAVATIEKADAMDVEGARYHIGDGLTRGYPSPLRDRDLARFESVRVRRTATGPWSITLRMLANVDITADMAKITAPVLVIAAIHDQIRPADDMVELAKSIPGAEVRRVETGHFAAVQTPDLLASEILAFLGRV